MKKNLLFKKLFHLAGIFIFCIPLSGSAQTVLDSCFASANPGVSFQSTATLGNATDADLLEWTGTTWIGDWSNAQINLAPPCATTGDRAIWMGDQTFWTTGGEGFSLKLNQPLVSGTSYSFTFTYVSHGLYSLATFHPYFNTNSVNDYNLSYPVGQLPGVGPSWTTNTYAFTATSSQNGHIWIIIHSNDGSGMVLNSCAIGANMNIGTDTILCNGDTLNVTADPGYNDYAWSTGDTTSSISITSAGVYYVTASTAQCVATDTIVVGYTPCNFPQSGFLSTDTTLCEKFCIDFIDQTTNNPTSWLWLFPGCVPDSSTEQNPTNICYQNPGTYDVTLITTNADGSDTLTLTDYITVFSTPPFPTITQNGLTLTSSPAGSYQWQFNSIDIGGATNQSYTVTDEGYYTVVISDSNGCINSATVFVEVTGIVEQQAGNNISVYPNPSSGLILLQFDADYRSDNLTVKVYNTLGQLVFMKEGTIASPGSVVPINLEQLPSGIYYLELTPADSTALDTQPLHIQKILVNR